MAKLRQLSQQNEHHSPGLSHRLNWDNLKVFIRAAELGSLRALAEEAGLAVNTVRKRIEQLEHELRTVLMLRGPSGIGLTEEGRRVYEIGVEMFDQARAIQRLGSGQQARAARAVVRLGVTEGIGAFWLAPHLSSLYEQHPNLQLELSCEMRLLDISRLEVDLAVQLDRPTDPNLKVFRLGYIHLMLFASRRFIGRCGEPDRLEDIPNFPFVELAAAQIPSEMLRQTVKSEDPARFIILRTNTSSAQAAAIAKGAGIGALPTYAAAITADIRPVVPDYHFRRDIWLVYHPAAGEMAHVRKVIDWLRQVFDSRRFPWFAEEFMSPEEIDTFVRRNDLRSTLAIY